MVVLYWNANVLDVQGTFLMKVNGENLYMEIPEGCERFNEGLNENKGGAAL